MFQNGPGGRLYLGLAGVSLVFLILGSTDYQNTFIYLNTRNHYNLTDYFLFLFIGNAAWIANRVGTHLEEHFFT